MDSVERIEQRSLREQLDTGTGILFLNLTCETSHYILLERKCIREDASVGVNGKNRYMAKA